MLLLLLRIIIIRL